jgi:hypothetical protein
VVVPPSPQCVTPPPLPVGVEGRGGGGGVEVVTGEGGGEREAKAGVGAAGFTTAYVSIRQHTPESSSSGVSICTFVMVKQVK